MTAHSRAGVGAEPVSGCWPRLWRVRGESQEKGQHVHVMSRRPHRPGLDPHLQCTAVCTCNEGSCL